MTILTVIKKKLIWNISTSETKFGIGRDNKNGPISKRWFVGIINHGRRLQYIVLLYYIFVLDLYRSIEKVPFFLFCKGVINKTKMQSVFWLFLTILARITIPSF